MDYFICEGVRLDGGNYIFDFRQDLDGDIVDLQFKSKPIKLRKRGGLEFFFAFKVKTKNNAIRQDFLLKLKHQEVELKDYEMFLNKAVVGLFSAYRVEEFDVIVIPQSSGKLSTDLARKIHAKAPHILFVPDTIVKNPPSNIKVNYELAKQKNLTDDTIKAIEKMILSASRNGKFEMKKVNPRFRKFITDILDFNDKAECRFYNSLVNGNVLVLDDYLKEGTTFKEINGLLSDYTPNDVVFYSLLY